MKYLLTLSLLAVFTFGPAQAEPLKKLAPWFGCSDFRDHYFSAVFAELAATDRLARAADLRQQMTELFADPDLQGKFAKLSDESKTRLRQSYLQLQAVVEIATRPEADELTNEGTGCEGRKGLWAEIEFGNRTTAPKLARWQKVQAQLSDFEKTMNDLLPQTECPTDTAEELVHPHEATGTLFNLWEMFEPQVVYGARKAFATAYQSCDVARLPALDKNTPDVEGIKIVGVHPDGIGKKRVISNLPALLHSDPYLEVSHSQANGCFDVTKSPLIYNYGGKTFPTTNNALDFFQSTGTGTSTLGVDCSGFVYTSLAVGGLKLKKKGHLKAYGVCGVAARMIQHPVENGFDCLNYAEFSATENLQAGDILASSGHVVVIDSIGQDPLGIEGLNSPQDCLPEKMAIERFDFHILQSNPGHGGIGINRHSAADYFHREPDMANALIQAAVTACLAKSAQDPLSVHSASASLIRHLAVSECMDTPIALVHQECVASCPVKPGD